MHGRSSGKTGPPVPGLTRVGGGAITTGGSGPPRIPWPMAIKTQEEMKHSHLKNYKAVARATTSRVLGGGAGLARGWWLQRGARHAEP